MRTGYLLLLAGGAISLSTPSCGGKLTTAETRWEFADAASTSTGATTGGGAGGSDDMDGAAGSGATGTGGAGTGGDPTTGTTTTGTTTTGTTGTGGTGTGGGGPGGTGGSGGGGGTVDAGAGCPESQPSNGTTCAQMGLTCGYSTVTCACIMSGGGGRGRDSGTTSWACAGAMDAGRGGRGAF
jgi:hypothetical protein